MKTLLSLAFVLCISTAAFAQQNTLGATTLSAASKSGDNYVVLTSTTGVNVQSANTIGSMLYIVDIGQIKGDLEIVTAVNTTTKVVNIRPNGGKKVAHASGAMVLVGQGNWFFQVDPQGSCVTASTLVAPYVNTDTGAQWLCSTISLTWVGGFQNPVAMQAPTVLVASASGATAINSPLQHINGTNAITIFTMGVGWNGGGFCVIPDAAFTTTATNNIAKASTAVANKTLCWTFDATNAVFTPTY